EKTAGGTGLWSGGDRRPLLEAIAYPNRRVQYEAALALGAAQPRQPFQGSERVVPILASAIRDASARYAIVIAPDAERQNAIADILRGKGYRLLPPSARLTDMEQAIADAPGIDLIVGWYEGLPPASAVDFVQQVRGRSTMAATPVLILTSG